MISGGDVALQHGEPPPLSFLMKGNIMKVEQQVLELDGLTNIQFNSDQGKNLRVQGMEAAIAHAESVQEGWKEAAYYFILVFPNKEFRNEEIRKFAYAKGLPQPPAERAWGGVIVRAARAGMIEKIGIEHSQNPEAHQAMVGKWRKTEKVDLISSMMDKVLQDMQDRSCG